MVEVHFPLSSQVSNFLFLGELSSNSTFLHFSQISTLPDPIYFSSLSSFSFLLNLNLNFYQYIEYFHRTQPFKRTNTNRWYNLSFSKTRSLDFQFRAKPFLLNYIQQLQARQYRDSFSLMLQLALAQVAGTAYRFISYLEHQ